MKLSINQVTGCIILQILKYLYIKTTITQNYWGTTLGLLKNWRDGNKSTLMLRVLGFAARNFILPFHAKQEAVLNFLLMDFRSLCRRTSWGRRFVLSTECWPHSQLRLTCKTATLVVSEPMLFPETSFTYNCTNL